MTDSPDAVLLYVPLMKETNMTWEEIKRTPRHELQGLLAACYEHHILHSMDGYSPEDVTRMAKDNPSVRGNWNRYMECRRKYSSQRSRENETQKQVEALKSQL